MRRAKKRMVWGLAACLLVGMLAGCGATTEEETTGSSGAGSAVMEQEQQAETWELGPTVCIDGEKMESDSIVQHETIMVSAEEFSDRMQAEYRFDPDTGALDLQWNDRTAELTLDQTGAVLNGEDVELEAPLLVEDTVYIPAEEVAEAFAADARTYHKALYITPYAGDWEVPAGYDVPVLMYHAVSDEIWGGDELFVSPSDMEAQLAYLKENGYTTITFEDLYHIDTIEKPVILTFDDGYDDNYENLYPLLQKYDCKATVFMVAGRIGSAETHKMTAEQLQEMSESGLVSIQSHTLTHEQLGLLSRKDQKAQMKQASNALLECTGKYPFVLCYPNGSYNDDTLEIAPKYYHFGIKINGGLYHTEDDPLLVSRYYISRYTDLSTFASYLG